MSAWRVHVSPVTGQVQVREGHHGDKGSRIVCIVAESRGIDERVMADAALLAAAQRMADALREIAALTASGGPGDPLVVLEQVSLALGRARGIAEGTLTMAGLATAAEGTLTMAGLATEARS